MRPNLVEKIIQNGYATTSDVDRIKTSLEKGYNTYSWKDFQIAVEYCDGIYGKYKYICKEFDALTILNPKAVEC